VCDVWDVAWVVGCGVLGVWVFMLSLLFRCCWIVWGHLLRFVGITEFVLYVGTVCWFSGFFCRWERV